VSVPETADKRLANLIHFCDAALHSVPDRKDRMLNGKKLRLIYDGHETFVDQVSVQEVEVD
jgi:hypothetical protein